jgi:hypothetical protein
MNQPTFTSVIDQTRIPLDLKAGLESAKPAATQQRGAKIEFEMQPQCHSSWCWAAVAASVSTFYKEAATFTQCHIANLELHRDDCCSVECHVDDVEFNRPHTLPLNRVGCLDQWVRDERATRTQLQQELAAGRPVCARVLWSSGEAGDELAPGIGGAGAHFVTIVGYLPDLDKLAIEDPWLGPTREIGYEQFCTHYTDAGGQWVDTYYTRAPAKAGRSAKKARGT